MPIYDYQGNVISIGGDTSYDWSGKKITFEGDSITSNCGMPEYVANQIGITANKISIAGVPVMGSYPGNAHDFRRRISNIPYNTDAIVVLADTNSNADWDYSEVDPFSQDITTWAGRWNVAIESMKRSFPTAPLFLASMFPVSKSSDVQYGRVQEASLAAAHYFERLANELGCIYIPIGAETGFSLQFAYPVWGLNGEHGVHPATSAVSWWASSIVNAIKRTRPPEWTGSSTISIDSTKTVAVGSTVDISKTITGDLSTQWTSSNMDVACVMGGRVYGMSAGTATITAKARSGATATCTVTVTS